MQRHAGMVTATGWLLAMSLVGHSLGAHAAGFCERMPMDPEFPAGLNGSYDIVGRDVRTGHAYTGTLALDHGREVYTLARTVQGRTVHGEAWMESCGVDRIRTLVVRYDAEPVIRMACSLGADGGNYYRVSCRTVQGGNDSPGLEAWYQRP
ncbi:hypothetical protein [Oxalicibacterium flavum]|nr:hypothetical protein [Oxalicibacterium flavum]